MTVAPGYGNDLLHLRQSSEQLREGFGSPRERREVGSSREYWLYPDKHLDCIVSRKTGRVLSIFLYEGNFLNEAGFFGRSEEDILSLYPSMPTAGGGFTLSNGDYVGRWLTYDEGIGFDFNASGKVRAISLFAPKQSLKRKPMVANQGHRTRMAALRVG